MSLRLSTDRLNLEIANHHIRYVYEHKCCDQSCLASYGIHVSELCSSNNRRCFTVPFTASLETCDQKNPKHQILPLLDDRSTELCSQPLKDLFDRVLSSNQPHEGLIRSCHRAWYPRRPPFWQATLDSVVSAQKVKFYFFNRCERFSTANRVLINVFNHNIDVKQICF